MAHIRPCPLCKEHRFRTLQKFLQGASSHDLVKCTTCSLLYIQPCPPSEKIIGQYLESNYFERGNSSKGYSNYLGDRELHVDFFRKQLIWLEKQTSPGKLLDVGCAAGFLIQEANQRGWQASGVEVSSFAGEYGRNVLGLDIFPGSLREARFPSNSFRAVIMNDVIEHFEDPLLEAQEVARVLEPGGIWLLHTPNAKSLWKIFMGRHWIHLKPSEHLTYFCSDTIQKLFQVCKLKPLMICATAKATNFHYIVRVMGKKVPFIANNLQKIFSSRKFWKKPFQFPGGGIQAAAVKIV